MNNILRDLYFGELRPHADLHPKTAAYKKNLMKIDEIANRLPALPENERETFAELLDAYDEIVGIIGEESFLQGFRLGGKITASMLSD